jgi:hypothetical protein
VSSEQVVCRLHVQAGKNCCHHPKHSLSTFIHSGAPGVEPHATVALGYQFESSMFVFCSPMIKIPPGNFLRKAGLRPTLPASLPPNARSTILEGLAARSIWRMILRYLFFCMEASGEESAPSGAGKKCKLYCGGAMESWAACGGPGNLLRRSSPAFRMRLILGPNRALFSEDFLERF